MNATKILWGQIFTVFAIVLATTWSATQWTAWQLGFQPQLGHRLGSILPVLLDLSAASLLLVVPVLV